MGASNHYSVGLDLDWWALRKRGALEEVRPRSEAVPVCARHHVPLEDDLVRDTRTCPLCRTPARAWAVRMHDGTEIDAPRVCVSSPPRLAVELLRSGMSVTQVCYRVHRHPKSVRRWARMIAEGRL